MIDYNKYNLSEDDYFAFFNIEETDLNEQNNNKIYIHIKRESHIYLHLGY